MDDPALVSGVTKLATAGQQAGFTVEQMVGLLNASLDVEHRMELIAWRLEQLGSWATVASSSGWVA